MIQSRRFWLILLFGLLLIGNVIYYIVSGWGLITVHAKEVSLSEIVRSIESQGHVTLVSNLDPERKVNMYVTRVPLMEALETLAAVTDSRWSLLYVVAPDRSKLAAGLEQIVKPEPSPDWKRIAVPLPPFVTIDSTEPIDPRRMNWRVEVPGTANLHDYLGQGAQSADVTFFLPSEWNPAIAAPPDSGRIEKVVSKLTSMARGVNREVFFLSEMRRQRGGEGGRPGGSFWQNFDMSRIDARIREQIEQLPLEERKEALVSYETRKAFFESMAALPPEQRREKMREFFMNPDNQDRMEARDSRRTPEQRAQRNSRYVGQRAAARGH